MKRVLGIAFALLTLGFMAPAEAKQQKTLAKMQLSPPTLHHSGIVIEVTVDMIDAMTGATTGNGHGQ